MIYGPNDYGDGFVTIEDLRAKFARLDDDAWYDEAARLEFDLARRIAAREEVLRISDEDWMRDEGWAEPWEGVVDGEFSRGYIFHPPTHGGWVMVPESPTHLMEEAGSLVEWPHPDIHGDIDAFDKITAAADVYHAMLRAAPSAPVGG